jgi:hypothetical protein
MTDEELQDIADRYVVEYNRCLLLIGNGKPLRSIDAFDAVRLWQASNPLNFGGANQRDKGAL